jgi:hypothetical protein
MALIKCTASTHGRHRWSSGPYKICHCLACGKKYVDLKEDPSLTGASVLKAMDVLRRADPTVVTMSMTVHCTCCLIHGRQTKETVRR